MCALGRRRLERVGRAANARSPGRATRDEHQGSAKASKVSTLSQHARTVICVLTDSFERGVGDHQHNGFVPRPEPIRFCFRITSGPNSGHAVGQFRVWTNGNDTYIADSGVASWKTSLHGDVAWRTAETRESNMSSDARMPAGTDRAPWKFSPPPFADGYRCAYVIGVTRGALRPLQVPERYHTAEVRDRWDELTKVSVWMAQPDVPASPASERIGPLLRLSNGLQVWAIAGAESIEGGLPQPAPVAALYEPQVPGVHDVHTPGLLVRGAVWSSKEKGATEQESRRRGQARIDASSQFRGPDAILAGNVQLPSHP